MDRPGVLERGGRGCGGIREGVVGLKAPQGPVQGCAGLASARGVPTIPRDSADALCVPGPGPGAEAVEPDKDSAEDNKETERQAESGAASWFKKK